MQEADMMCAVHALNSLVQYPLWDAVTLAQIARDLDKLENELIITSGDSNNVREDGFFSIQAISKALEAYNLKLNYFNCNNDPCSEVGFICNYHLHWISVRKIDGIWFNLDSLANNPEIISDFMLSAWISGLSQRGFSIFQVTGRFPVFEVYPELSPAQLRIPVNNIRRFGNRQAYNEQDELKKALELSKREIGKSNSRLVNSGSGHSIQTEEEMLKKAIELSMQASNQFIPLNEDYYDEDEEQLKLAIEMSKQL